MLQHTQSHCLTCQRPTLHVRNSYDVPHLGHLIFFCFLSMAAVVTRDASTSTAFAAGAGVWLIVWAFHAIANLRSNDPPFRCHQCGSRHALHTELAAMSEKQRLEAAMAKAAAMNGKAGATG